MGQALGCCSNNNVDNNDLKTNDFSNNLSKLKHPEKLRLIIKIQASMRGFLGRKRVQKLRGGNTGGTYKGGLFNNH